MAIQLLLVNEADCDPPMRQEDVEKTAASAWRFQTAGRNRVGQGRYANVPEERFERLADAPDAFALDTRMRLTHEGPRDRFVASPKAMAAAKRVMPGWTAARYCKAIRVLIERGVWDLLKRGGRGARDPHEYGFAGCPRRALKSTAKGSEIGPNTNRTPPPLSQGRVAAAQVRKRTAS